MRVPPNLDKSLSKLDLPEFTEEHKTAVLKSLPVDEQLQMINEIPVQHQEFIENYLETGEKAESYRLAFKKKHRADCYANASILFKKYDWLFYALLEKQGLTDRLATVTHRKLLQDSKGLVRLGALKLYYELTGRIDKANQVTQQSMIIVKDKEKGVYSVNGMVNH